MAEVSFTDWLNYSPELREKQTFTIQIPGRLANVKHEAHPDWPISFWMEFFVHTDYRVETAAVLRAAADAIEKA